MYPPILVQYKLPNLVRKLHDSHNTYVLKWLHFRTILLLDKDNMIEYMCCNHSLYKPLKSLYKDHSWVYTAPSTSQNNLRILVVQASIRNTLYSLAYSRHIFRTALHCICPQVIL